MRKNLRIVKAIPLAFLSFLFISISCNKDGGGGGGGGTFGPTGGNKIEGVVMDANMNPVADVMVSAYGDSTKTSSNGEYTLSADLSNRDRAIISFDKDGYFSNNRGFVPQDGKTTFLNVALIERQEIGAFDNSTGGSVSDNSGKMSLTFQSESFKKEGGGSYSGEVKIYGAYMDPDDSNFDMVMPGGDLAAIDENNEDGMLTSFGMVAVETEDDNGAPLALLIDFDLCVDIPASMLAAAPSQMPVWFMANSTWEFMGNAIKMGDQYCFTSGETGSINCDLFNRSAIIKGYLCDGGDILPNEHLRLGQICVTTGTDGSFSAMVPSGMTINVLYNGISKTIGPFSPNSVHDCVLIGDCPSNINCSPTSTGNLGSYTISGNSNGVDGSYEIKNALFENDGDEAVLYFTDATIEEFLNDDVDHVVGFQINVSQATGLPSGTYTWDMNSVDPFTFFDVVIAVVPDNWACIDLYSGVLEVNKTGANYKCDFNLDMSDVYGGGNVTGSFSGPLTTQTKNSSDLNDYIGRALNK